VKRKLCWLLALSIVFPLFAGGLLICRNFELELADRALKSESGNEALRHLLPLAYLGDSKAQLL
jgi:hypothetical protein